MTDDDTDEVIEAIQGKLEDLKKAKKVHSKVLKELEGLEGQLQASVLTSILTDLMIKESDDLVEAQAKVAIVARSMMAILDVCGQFEDEEEKEDEFEAAIKNLKFKQ